MDEFKFFKNFKERGEWAEARFMADAMRHGYKVLKPWGDSSPFDVALCFGNRIERVQVKSTSCRLGTVQAQLLQRTLHHRPTRILRRLRHHARYTWYLIPARLVLGDVNKQAIMLCPMEPEKRGRYLYESYREAWPLLRPSQRPKPCSGKK